MYIHKIKIENIRCFEKVDLDLTRPDGSLAGWTVIAGRNGTGKSTFLKSMAIASVGTERARGALSPSSASWIQLGFDSARLELGLNDGEQKASELVVEFHPDDAANSAKFAFQRMVEALALSHDELTESAKRLQVKSNPWTPDPKTVARLRKLLAEDAKASSRRGQEAQSPVEKQPIVIGYGPYRRLSGHAYDAQQLMAGPAEIARVVSLFREDASLVEGLTWLREVYLRRLEQNAVDARLERVVLDLLDDGLLPDGAKVEKIDSDGLWIRQNGVSLSLHELSDGYRTVAALVLDIVRHLHNAYGDLQVSKLKGAEEARLQITNPAVVLIDEVDLHLHVSWQKRIGFWLKHHFPNIQFLVTSHSPFICQAADPGGLIRLPMPGEGRQVEKVSEELYNTVVNGSLDEAVLSELFGLDSLYSTETEKLRNAVAALEAKAIRGKLTSADEKKLEKLRRKLPGSMTSDVEVILRSLRGDK